MDTGGKFSYFPVAVVDLDTLGLYNMKQKFEFAEKLDSCVKPGK